MAWPNGNTLTSGGPPIRHKCSTGRHLTSSNERMFAAIPDSAGSTPTKCTWRTSEERSKQRPLNTKKPGPLMRESRVKNTFRTIVPTGVRRNRSVTAYLAAARAAS